MCKKKQDGTMWIQNLYSNCIPFDYNFNVGVGMALMGSVSTFNLPHSHVGQNSGQHHQSIPGFAQHFSATSKYQTQSSLGPTPLLSHPKAAHPAFNRIQHTSLKADLSRLATARPKSFTLDQPSPKKTIIL